MSSSMRSFVRRGLPTTLDGFYHPENVSEAIYPERSEISNISVVSDASDTHPDENPHLNLGSQPDYLEVVKLLNSTSLLANPLTTLNEFKANSDYCLTYRVNPVSGAAPLRNKEHPTWARSNSTSNIAEAFAADQFYFIRQTSIPINSLFPLTFDLSRTAQFFLFNTEDELANDPNWLTALQRGKSVPVPKGELGKAFIAIRDAAMAHLFGKIDLWLSRSDPRQMRVEAMIALLRYPFAHRKELKEWNGLLKRSSEELRQRGLNPEQTFPGLDVD